MHTKNFIRPALITALILLIPLYGDFYIKGWNWSPGDFLLMGAIIFGAGLAYEFLATRGGNSAYRLASGIGILAALVLFWINAAVGIIGDGHINMLYPLVPLVGIIGAALVRLAPCGMMWTLFAMAASQMLIPIIALLAGVSDFAPGVLEVFGMNAVFALAFIASALLFRYASRNPA